MRFNQPLFFFVLLALVAAARLCHVEILWAEETLPLAAAEQVLHGKTLYRDVWFDKPPLVAAINLLWGARDSWPLRLAGALYQLLACWLAFRFARDLWSPAEGYWAAGLVGFFLTFDFPSAVIPLASDLLLVVPHLAAVWLAWKGRPFASGLWLGVGFLISPKALFVAAVCAVWYPSGVFWMAAGFLAASGVATLWLAAAGAFASYWDQVWRWGRVYASTPSLDRPVWNAMVRTADWAGFHIALLAAAVWYFGSGRKAGEPSPRLWAGWCGLSLMAVATGFRFFPRYYFFFLPPLALAAARGSTLLGRRRVWIALLLLIPLARFGPRYALLAARHIDWVDTSMDRDSRAAAAVARPLARLGSTLFVWGFRPELYVYAGLPAATRFLDSQPLTGVPADRHLTQSTPVETIFARAHRGELARSSPTFIMDGLGLYNPRLAITQFPDLAEWLSHYREVGRVGGTVIYQVIPAPP